MVCSLRRWNVRPMPNASRTTHGFSADWGSTMNVQFSVFTPAQLLCNWHEQRPSNEGDLDSSGTERLSRHGADFIFFLSYTWLIRGFVVNGTSCITEEFGVAATPYTSAWFKYWLAWYSSVPQGQFRDSTKITTWPLPSISFPIYQPSVTVWFDATFFSHYHTDNVVS